MRILSISGGGFQALYGVYLLEHLERCIGPLADTFGMFCGTSAGAIVAAAASARIPMSDLAHGFATRGAQAFQPRHTGWGREVLRRFQMAKYDPAPLESLVEEICGDRTFAQMERPLAVTAVRVQDGAAVLFEPGQHGDVRVRDAVMASAAAPTMFPAVRVQGALYADGAIFANAPDLLAIDLARSSKMSSLGAMRMLSVGSMNACPPLHEPQNADMGVLAWLRGNRIFRTMIGSQVAMTTHLAQGLMGDRYTRIDADPNGPGRDDVGLDKATPKAIAATARAARASIPDLEAWISREGLV